MLADAAVDEATAKRILISPSSFGRKMLRRAENALRNVRYCFCRWQAFRLPALVLILTAAVAPLCSAQCPPVCPAPATVTKRFSPEMVNDGQATALTFTFNNPANSQGVSITFVDALPLGLRVANPPEIGGTCTTLFGASIHAVAGGSTISTVRMQLPAGGVRGRSCTVQVNVTNAQGQYNSSCAANPSDFTNAAGNVTVDGAVNSVAPSCLTVFGSPHVEVPTLSQWLLIGLATVLGIVAVGSVRRRL